LVDQGKTEWGLKPPPPPSPSVPVWLFCRGLLFAAIATGSCGLSYLPARFPSAPSLSFQNTNRVNGKVCMCVCVCVCVYALPFGEAAFRYPCATALPASGRSCNMRVYVGCEAKNLCSVFFACVLRAAQHGQKGEHCRLRRFGS